MCLCKRERYTLKAGDQSYLKDKICYSSPTDHSESRLAAVGRAQILAIPSGAARGRDVKGRSPQPYRGTAQPPAGSQPPPARGGQLPQPRSSPPTRRRWRDALRRRVWRSQLLFDVSTCSGLGGAGVGERSSAWPSLSLCSPAAGGLLPPTVCPAPVRPGGERGAPTPSPPQIHRRNLPNFLHPWHQDSLPCPPPTPPATSPHQRLGTAQVSRGCAGRRRPSPAGHPRWGRGGGAESFEGESPSANASCAAGTP